MSAAAAAWQVLATRVGVRIAADPDGEHAVAHLSELFDEVLLADIGGSLSARIVRSMRVAREITRFSDDAPRLKGVAAHEAAHTYYLHRFGFTLHDATIDPMRDAQTDGIVVFSGYCPDAAFSMADRQRVEQRILIELAGPIAQDIALGVDGYAVPAASWATHRRDALDVARRIPARMVGDTPDAFVAWLEDRARAMVREDWSKIRGLSEHLVKVRTMAGPDMHAFITDLHRRESEAVESELLPATSPSSDT